MAGLVECVPNFSEGRDASKVQQIVAAMAAVPGARVLDQSMDPGHNRLGSHPTGGPGGGG